MEYAFFISPTYLKETTPISGNNDISEIYAYAKAAEDVYIQEAIGTPLFNRLIESLIASPKNTTADEITLLKKIRPALAWYTCYDALPFLAIKIRNIGVVNQGGENLQNGARDDVSYLRKLCKDKADFYMRLVQNYLCENSQKFDEYRCSGWGCNEGVGPNTVVSKSCALALDYGTDDYYEQKAWRRILGR